MHENARDSAGPQTVMKKNLYTRLHSISLLALLLVASGCTHGADAAPEVDLFNLPLEELMAIKLQSSAALTPTALTDQPAAMTVLDENIIRFSGATTPDELMELYVPNMQMLQTTFYGRAIGFRGVQLVRGERYLLMVDGQPMNFRIFDGAISERQLALMGDLKGLSVVHGPGSFLYGPGAEIATINLDTHDGLSFQGASASSQYNPVDNLQSLEVRAGHRLSEQSGLFFYAGIADYQGPDYRDAPIYFGHSFTSFSGPVQGGTAADVLPFDHVNGSSNPQEKLFARYDNGNFNAWVRYTQQRLTPPQPWSFVQDGTATFLPIINGKLTANPAVNLDWFYNRSYEDHRQLMAVMNYRQAFNADLQLEYHLAYHQTRYRWLRPQTLNPLEFRINEFADDGHIEAKAIATWKPSQSHTVAAGTEVRYQPFQSRRRIENGADLAAFNADWTTSTHALMLEDQWQFSDTTTSFAGFRLDKHDYTRWYFSPRLALVHELNEHDRLKAIAARSLRRPMEILMLLDRRAEPGKSFKPETLDSLELRWERQQSPALSYDASVVFERLNAFDTALNGNQSEAGLFNIGAVELALKYQSEHWQLAASHSYTQLLDAKQSANVPVTVISVADAENGIGRDLGFWSNHLSKIALLFDINRTLTLSSSLVHYWGFPGTDDFSQWVTANAGTALPGTTYNRYGVYDGSNTRTAKGNTYFNAGLKWQASPRLNVALDGYNLLGLLDEEISKRNFIGENAGGYQIDPASFAIKLDYHF